MEGVTVEYGKGFTAGTERRESGSMGRLAEHTAGLGGRRSRWDGVGPVELLAFCTWATLFLVTWRFSLPVTSLVGLLILLEKTHVILFLYFCLYLVRSISCFPNQLEMNQRGGSFRFHFIREDFAVALGIILPTLMTEEQFTSTFSGLSKGSHRPELGWSSAETHCAPREEQSKGILIFWDAELWTLCVLGLALLLLNPVLTSACTCLSMFVLGILDPWRNYPMLMYGQNQESQGITQVTPLPTCSGSLEEDAASPIPHRDNSEN